MIVELERHRDRIIGACRRNGVARLHLFGSALRADYRPDASDVDLLVELQPMAPEARVDAYFGLLEELRQIFGERVDLVMTGAVKNPWIAREIERTKRLLYAA